MKDPGQSTSNISLTDRVRGLTIGMPVTAVHFLGDNAAFVGAEESVALVNGDGEISRVAVHGGGILCAAFDGTRIVMGGDDGKLVALDTKGEVALIATDPKRRWIDNVALHPDGAVAWSAGKILRCAVDRRWAGVCPERPASCDRALHRRDLVVS